MNPLDKIDLNSNSSNASFRIENVTRFKGLNSDLQPSEKKRNDFSFGLEECEKDGSLPKIKKITRKSEKFLRSPLKEIDTSPIRPLNFKTLGSLPDNRKIIY